MSKKKDNVEFQIKEDQGLCVKHGAVIGRGNFYQVSEGSIFSGMGYLAVCKSCIMKQFNKYSEIHKDNKKAVYYLCRWLDLSYSDSLYESVLRNPRWNGEADKIFGLYMTLYNSLGKENKMAELNFDSGESIFEGVRIKNNTDNEDDQEKVDEGVVELTELTKQNKKEVIGFLEYDPFEGHSIEDQNYLYNDLLPYLADEDIKEDNFLVSQIVQIVNNNNAIRKYNAIISNLSSTSEKAKENQAEITSIINLQKAIVFNTDKLAKENNIAVGKRKDGGGQKSSFTKLMGYLRALNFQDAEVDYYDQRKAYGMMRAAKISFAAMKEQFFFDDDQINDMILEMRERIVKYQEMEIEKDEIIRRLINLLIDNNIEYLDSEADSEDSFENFDASFLDE